MTTQIERADNTASFLRELELLRNAQRAIADQLYHKSSREHWGVSVPQCDKLARTFSKKLTDIELLSLAKDLWETNLFDPMVCAAKMVTLKRLHPSPALWQTILHFLKQVDGWALEDHLAHVAWKCILADESLLYEIEEWTKHHNFWMRRAALVYTLPFAKPNRNPERMLQWASSYASDPEWFIQKAIGWWLRVLGEHNPKQVSLFLYAHWEKLKGVAKKEATRKLSVEWRERIDQQINNR
ncbi:MAG: DNA alkylation repair protein [Chlamydiales bacterium]